MDRLLCFFSMVICLTPLVGVGLAVLPFQQAADVHQPVRQKNRGDDEGDCKDARGGSIGFKFVAQRIVHRDWQRLRIGR